MFATRVNVKVDRYYAFYVEPDSKGTNAFSCNWESEFFYAFPPFSIIQLVLKKIECENAQGVTVAPFYTTQACFKRLTRILVWDPLPLPINKKALYFPYRRKTIPQIANVKLCHVSGNNTTIGNTRPSCRCSDSLLAQ